MGDALTLALAIQSIEKLQREIKVWRRVSLVLFIGGTITWLANLAGACH